MAVTYSPIQTVAITGFNTITFSSIPNTYTDLRLVIHATGSGGSPWFIINADQQTSYSSNRFQSTPTTSAWAQQLSVSAVYWHNALSLSATPVSLTLDIFSYASTAIFKPMLMTAFGNTSSSQGNIGIGTAQWRSTTAINRIDCLSPGAWSTGTATLYGIKAA